MHRGANSKSCTVLMLVLHHSHCTPIASIQHRKATLLELPLIMAGAAQLSSIKATRYKLRESEQRPRPRDLALVHSLLLRDQLPLSTLQSAPPAARILHTLSMNGDGWPWPAR